MINTILFDFGGTLDTNGIHWSEKFWEVYQKFNIPITKDIYNKAYLNAEPNINSVLTKEDGLLKTLETQVGFQFKYLANEDFIKKETALRTANEIAFHCFKDVCKNVVDVKPFLETLKTDFSLGVVSNYYGNIETVLDELSIRDFFDTVVDSSLVKLFKPDPEIFAYAIRELNRKPYETVVVGDSYDRDILPAKLLGCKTIWLKVKSWRDFSDQEAADAIISNITELMQQINMFNNSIDLQKKC